MNTDRRNLYIPQDENETKRVYEIVKGILLSKCVEIFSSFKDDRNQGRFRKNEVPPKDAIVYLQECENPEIAAECYEKTGVLPEPQNINAWHLEKGTLELLDDPNTEADQKDKNIRAMYYKQATFRIKIDIENAQGFLDFTMGPLFGRGFVVDIMGDINITSFEEIKTYIEQIGFFHDHRVGNIEYDGKVAKITVEEIVPDKHISESAGNIWDFTITDIESFHMNCDCAFTWILNEVTLEDGELVFNCTNGYVSIKATEIKLGIPTQEADKL